MKRAARLSAICIELCIAGCTVERPDAPRSAIVVPPRPDHSTSKVVDPELERRWNGFYSSEFDRGDTVVVGTNSDADSLSPLYALTSTGVEVVSLIFDSLLRIYPDSSRGPGLVKSWEFTDEGRRVVFHLREDVRWHDGAPFTARDVKFTHELAIDPRTRFRSQNYKRNILECSIVDEHTVAFVFDKVYHYQLMDAAIPPPVPEHLLRDVPRQELSRHEFNRRPIGTGPFRLKEWRTKESIELVENPAFHGGRPGLSRILFKVIPDSVNRVLQAKNGEVDVLCHLERAEFEDLARQPHLAAWSLPGRRYFFLGWNNERPLFRSRAVRQALTHAIDRESMVRAIFGDAAEVCRGPVSPIQWGYHPELRDFAYDPEKARGLLAEEGWKDSDGDGILDKDGVEFSFKLMSNQSNQAKLDTVTHVQAMLRRIGIEVIPEIVLDVPFQEAMLARRFDAVVGGWAVALKMDLAPFWHSRSIGSEGKPGYNVVAYRNPELDAIVDQAVAELDIEKAKQLWRRAQEIIVEDQPYTFLYTPRQLNVVHSRLRNVQMEVVGWHYNIEQWWSPRALQRPAAAAEGN